MAETIERDVQLPSAATGRRYPATKLSFRATDYERLERAADANGLAVAAYIRQAVLWRIARDETEGIYPGSLSHQSQRRK